MGEDGGNVNVPNGQLNLGSGTDNGAVYFSDASTWTGNAGSGEGKLEYHNGAFYLNSGDSGSNIIQFRNAGGNDVVNIQNNGDIVLNNDNVLKSDQGLQVGTCSKDNCISHNNVDLHLNHGNSNDVQIGDNGGNLIMNGQNINNVGVVNTNSVQDRTGDRDIQLNSDNEIALRNNNNNDVLRAKDTGTVEIVRGNLDVKGNRIVNVPAPSSGGDAVNKTYVDTSDDTVADNQDLSQVLSQGNSAGSYNIDMNGNNVLSGGDVRLGNTQAFEIADTGGANIRVATLTGSDHVIMGDVDGTSGDTYIRDDGTNTIIARNGDMYVPNGDILNPGFRLQNNGVLKSRRSDGNLYFDIESSGGKIFLRTDGNKNIITAKDSGGVSIPNGNLNIASGDLSMGGNSIRNVHSISDSSNIKFMRDGTSDDGSYEWVGWYSGSSRAGIFLWDGSWSGCDGNEFCVIGDSHQLELKSRTGSVAINDSVSVHGNVNMNGNQIESVATPNDPQDVATKDYVDSSDGTGTDDQTLEEVLNQGNNAGSNNINMSGNNILEGGLSTSGGFTSSDDYISGGTASFSVLDDGSGSEIDVVSTIEMNANTIQSNDGSKFAITDINQLGSMNINNGNDISGISELNGGSALHLQHQGSNGRLEIGAGSGTITTDFNNQQLTNIGGTDCAADEAVLGDGSCGATSDPQNLSQVLSQGNSAGSYNIDLDGNEIVDSAGSTTLGGGNVNIPDGRLSLGGNLRFTGGSSLSFRQSSSQLSIYDAGSITDRVVFKEGGKVKIRSGILNMTGHEIVSVSDPTDPQDAATKSYVDNNDATGSTDSNSDSEDQQLGYSSDGTSSSGAVTDSISITDGNGNTVNSINFDDDYEADTDTDNQNLNQVLSQGNSASDRNINDANTIKANAIQDGDGGNQIEVQDSINMNGNRIKQNGNYIWGAINLDSDSYQLWNGENGTITRPSSGNTNCVNNDTCIRNHGNGKWTLEFEMHSQLASGPDVSDGYVCWGWGSADSESTASREGWGAGVRSVGMDSNGHCTGENVNGGKGITDCVDAYVYDTSVTSQDTYGVMCRKPDKR